MKRIRVRNETRDRVLGDRIRVADRIWSRLIGLLLGPEPREGEGLLIVPSRGVHMYGMRFPLDVILLDGGGRAAAVYPELRPGTRTRFHKEARVALEVGVGTIARTGTCVGDHLEWTTNGAGGL